MLNVGVLGEVVINVLFVVIGDISELWLLGIDNWLIVFWIVMFKCLN